MQELLRNQVVAPRDGNHTESHREAEAAVLRLRRLRDGGDVPAAALPAPRPAAAPVFRTFRRARLAGAATGVAVLAALGFAILLPSPLATGAGVPGDNGLGSGFVRPDRSADLDYTVREGDTLAGIAELHGLDYGTLALYNNLSNPDLLPAGATLAIPSIEHERVLRGRQTFKPVTVKATRSANAGEADQLVIRAERQYDGAALTAHFAVDAPNGQPISSYVWDLGNGKQSYRPNPYWSYEEPGTYAVRLNARLKDGPALVSNTIYIDVPHPGSFQGGNQRFITLNSLQDSFRIDGGIISVNGETDLSAAPISKVGQDGAAGVYQITQPGYYAIGLDGPAGGTVYLFASPVPSVHSDRADMNWYRTQFNTGTLSNCGPSSVSMAYAWAKGGYLPVSSVRQAVGWKGNGSTSYEELVRVLRDNGVGNRSLDVRGAKDLFRIVDGGGIAIILINTGGIRRSAGGLADPFGRHYSDVVGHYVVLKGYSADHKYFIIHDPIPSDWSANSFRQADGISMSGRNRYYPVDDVMRALRTSTVLEIQR
jgi:PKD repeat protein